VMKGEASCRSPYTPSDLQAAASHHDGYTCRLT